MYVHVYMQLFEYALEPKEYVCMYICMYICMYVCMYVKAIRVMLLGGLAGGVSKFIVYPLDTVKKRLQAQV